ncbi:MAG: TonB-dependent receptor plug domain-containing protein [Flavobacteriales bacterium]|nr:TonB-dependent receptor plug domain-containing protein [Flavobacteriales bacterium]
MKQCLLVIFTLSCSCLGFGQTQIEILSSSRESLSGVSFMYWSLESQSKVETKVTDEYGMIEVPKTAMLFEIEVIGKGFKSYYDTIDFLNNRTIQLSKLEELDEVCVTAQYRATSIENSVQKVSIITAEQIQQSGANNLTDVLSYQSGIRLTQDNILGSTINLSGVSGQNVKLLIDGVPVIGRQNGNIDLSQINLNNVERIEIIEGPLSVNFGTNALGGTINLISKKTVDRGLHINFNPYYESIGNYNLNVGAGFRYKKHSINLSGGRNYFDGWSDIDPFFMFPKERLADTNRFKTWKPKEQYFMDLNMRTELKGWNLQAYTRYFDEVIINRGFPSAPYYEIAFDDYYNTNRTDLGMIAKKSFEKSNIKTNLAFNQFTRIKNTYYHDLTTLVQTLALSEGAQDTSNFSLGSLRTTYSSRLNKKLDYQIGIDLSYEFGTGKRIKNRTQNIGDYAGFGSFEWKPVKSLIVKPGLRYSYNTVYASPLTPSLNLRYKFRKFTIRTAIARGFRAPSLKELYLDFVDINHNINGNTELLSERSWNYSGFINWQLQLEKNRLLKIEYGGSFNDINNLITLGLQEDGSYTYINIGTYKTISQQGSIGFQTKKFKLRLNGTYIGRYNPSFQQESVPTFSFSPELSSKINYQFFDRHLGISLFYKFNGVLQSFSLDSEDNISINNQSAYHILDASVTLKLIPESRLIITSGAKNILNVKEVKIIGQTQGVHTSNGNLNAGRGVSVFVSIKYKLNIQFKSHEK